MNHTSPVSGAPIQPGERLVPSPALAAALEAYGRAWCRTAHLSTTARWNALEAAEQALLRVIEGERDGEGVGEDGDTGPRRFIPRGLLEGA